MNRDEKIILIRNAVETLGYFSEQIAAEMRRCGFDVCFLDYDALFETLGSLPYFVRTGRTWLVTFNFIGVSGEEIFVGEDGRYLWESYGIQCLNILVDHPFYFHSRLKEMLPWVTVFCVDREHAAYIRRFYPGVEVHFLPLAGNMPLEEACFRQSDAQSADERVRDLKSVLASYMARRYDLVFTANYVPLEGISQKIERLDPEYQAFYRGILSDLAGNPAQSVDAVMERHLTTELGALPYDEKRAAMAGMAVLDLYLRSYFRGEIIGMLAAAGVKIHVFGADWEKLACRKPENIIKNGGQTDSAACLAAIRDARISLNLMPWFKDGAHDRIFTSMLQKTVALTDDSRYLREEFSDGEELVFFSLSEREKLPDLIFGLLSEPERAVRIAENGYYAARGRHTWRQRTRRLLAEIVKQTP